MSNQIVSLAVIEKGERLVRNGRVRRILRGRYIVHSDTGRFYFVHKGKCRCKWNQYPAAENRVCSHEYAALLTEAKRKYGLNRRFSLSRFLGKVNA